MATNPCVPPVSGSLTLDAFPQEILSRIFHQLTAEDLERCASVSISWSAIVHKVKTEDKEPAAAKTPAAEIGEGGDVNQAVAHAQLKPGPQPANKAADNADGGSVGVPPTAAGGGDNSSAPSLFSFGGTYATQTGPQQQVYGKYFLFNSVGVQVGSAGLEMSTSPVDPTNEGAVYSTAESGARKWIKWNAGAAPVGRINLLHRETYRRVVDPAVLAEFRNDLGPAQEVADADADDEYDEDEDDWDDYDEEEDADDEEDATAYNDTDLGDDEEEVDVYEETDADDDDEPEETEG